MTYVVGPPRPLRACRNPTETMPGASSDEATRASAPDGRMSGGES